MTEKQLARIFGWGTAVFLIALVVMSVDTLGKVTRGRTPPLTDDVAAGKAAWQRKNCNDCHTILGIGAYYAPDLTKVAGRRDDAWTVRWLSNPAAVKPGTTMPDQRLTNDEVVRLVAFFRWVHGIDTNNWPPSPVGGGSGGGLVAGALLFQQKGCTACHVAGGVGVAGLGPDLLDRDPDVLALLGRAVQRPGAHSDRADGL